jgi:protein-S-isoprenylcysteine O-methyltransferase Ste14
MINRPVLERAQERMMLEAFGDSYRAFMARTGRVFPPIFLK